MDPSKPAVSSTLGEAKYIDFACLPEGTKHEDGTLALNRWSSTITRGHDFPGAKVGYYFPVFIYWILT
jgi:dihydroxy-acid dehydratase